jgi:hypothetical protein
MGRYFLFLHGLAIVTVGILISAALLSMRYDYHPVSLAAGFYTVLHDKWTSRDCAVYSNAWDLVPDGLEPCEATRMFENLADSATGLLDQVFERIASNDR